MVLAPLLRFLSFLSGPVGILCLMMGFLAFVLLPVLSKPIGNRTFANIPLWFSQFANGRTALVIGEHGDLYHKQMSFDDLGVEKIKFGSELKLFEDPDDSLTTWINGKFALALEGAGVLITPFHAAVGRRKRQADEENELVVRSTDKEYDTYGVSYWHKGVFSMPSAYELVDLSYAKELVAGGERSEWPERVKEFYKHSRRPYNNARTALRLFAILAAILGPFILLGLLADQLGGASPTSSVSFGALFLLLSVPSTDGVMKKIKSINWMRVLKTLILILVPTGFIGALAYFISPTFAIYVVVALALGFGFMPFLTVLGRASDKIGGALSGLYLQLGLMGYNAPVWVYGPKGYSLHEHADLDDTHEVAWYSLKGSTVGFSFEPDPENYAESYSADDIEVRSEIATDGGSDGVSNIPPKHVRSEQFSRARYGGFVPKNPDSSKWYVAAGRALNRLAGACEGEKSEKRLDWAKEQFGMGNFAISTKAMYYTVFVGGLISFGLGVFVFFL